MGCRDALRSHRPCGAADSFRPSPPKAVRNSGIAGASGLGLRRRGSAWKLVPPPIAPGPLKAAVYMGFSQSLWRSPRDFPRIRAAV